MGRKLKDPNTEVWIHPMVIWMWDRIRNSGMTQEKISYASGVGTSTMRKWLRGQSSPRLEDIEAVINALGGVLVAKDEPKVFIDPPSGWKYGFPKPIPRHELHRANEWIVENGYPQSIVDEMGDNFRYRCLES